jgi:SAM-dependent methyltransferase
MAHAWVVFGKRRDEEGRSTKQGLITPNAHGVVLEIGAGHGHTAGYLDPKKVTKYVALEPNIRMHPYIRASAKGAGFTEEDATLVILSCGAEDSTSILRALGTNQPPADTILSISTLCSVPSPQLTIRNLVGDVLKPGGQFLFFEHVLSPREDVAWWQRAWAPICAIPFGGCRSDRPTHIWVDALTLPQDNGVETSAWSDRQLWGKEGESEEDIFWHQVGKFVRCT